MLLLAGEAGRKLQAAVLKDVREPGSLEGAAAGAEVLMKRMLAWPVWSQLLGWLAEAAQEVLEAGAGPSGATAA